MASLSRKIKNVLHSKSTPDFIFSWYFSWKNNKDRKELFSKLAEQKDLIKLVSPKEQEHWNGRIETVLRSSDNEDIPRHKLAGQLKGEEFIMHNGIKVDPLSYYSYPVLKMLMLNKGVHEPQEEKIFQIVLDTLPQDRRHTMLELGSYWSFYSMWFLQKNPQADCYMVEPNRKNLFYGKRNLELNGMKGTFIHGGISKQKDVKNNITTVDEICAQHQIEFLDILHSDIQGFEYEMLHGSEKLFSENKVGYVFISTHSNELHEQCYNFLKNKYGFTLVASANVDESFSWDGILVMKNPDYPGIESVEISKREKQKI